jgi:hypothetical protein
MGRIEGARRHAPLRDELELRRDLAVALARH